MRPITAADVLEAGDVLHHPAFGFATVEAVDGLITSVSWERPGVAQPPRVVRGNLQASYRRCDPRGFLATTIRDPDLARSLFGSEPLDAIALLLGDIGAASREEIRDWLVDRHLLAEPRFDEWWASILPFATADARFLVKAPAIQLKPDLDLETLTRMLEGPLPAPGTLGVGGLWAFTRMLARAAALAHAGGETLVRDRAAVRMRPGSITLPTSPKATRADRREDVRFLVRLALEQHLGRLPSPTDLPDADLGCLVLSVNPAIPPEFLAVAQPALAADADLRPADGLALLERLTVAEAAATLRGSAPHFANAEVSVGFNSHIGTIKSLQGQTNQDSFFLVGEPRLALIGVCDGISLSSAGSGDLAAAIASRTLRNQFSQQSANLSEASPGKLTQFLIESLRRANRAICETALKLADGDIARNIPMGTTFVAAVTQGNRISLAALGDSRAYLVGPYGVAQVTGDQNLQANRLKDVLGGSAVVWDEPRYSLTGYLGHFTLDGKPELAPVFTRTLILLPGEWLVLCSDGLTDYAAGEDGAVLRIIQDAIREAKGSTAGAVGMDITRRLVDAANRGGGGDNVTVLALTLSPDYGAASADPPVAS